MLTKRPPRAGITPEHIRAVADLLKALAPYVILLAAPLLSRSVPTPGVDTEVAASAAESVPK